MARRKRKIIEGLKIEHIAPEGKGLTHHEGKVIFVEGAVPGDVVDVSLIRNKKDYAIGKPVRYLKSSPDRTVPFCEHFEHCGGCKCQNLRYDRQLALKMQIVKDAFSRIGKVQLPALQPIIGSDLERFYRNRLDFAFSNKRWLTQEEIDSGKKVTNREGLGFHLAGAFDKVLDINTCWLQDDIQNQIRNGLRSFALDNGLTFFDLRKQSGFLRNLIIRNTTLGEWMVIIGFYEDLPRERDMVLNWLKDDFPQLTSIQYVINPKGNDTYFDLVVVNWHGRDHIIEQLGDYRFKIGPKSFFQTNSLQAGRLYEKVLALAALTGKEVVYDLYTGTGTIALYLARYCQKIVGIEQVPEAIEDAQFNAALNSIENAEFRVGDMKDVLAPGFAEAHGRADVIITDPPRAGMHPEVVKTILELKPKKIVYVSCNPVTQARDVNLLSEAYTVTHLQPVDMFPHTWHVENICVLEHHLHPQ